MKIHPPSSKMLLCCVFLVATFNVNYVYGIDGNSITPRENCYRNEQPNCNTEFIDAYPEFSKSIAGLTNATTWFLLFTRENPEIPEKLHKCGGKLPPNTNFNPKNRLIVILTPFTTGMCDTAFHREWVVQILIREPANVLAVDWSWGDRYDIGSINYNTIIVANQTAIVLRNIQNETGIMKDKIYLVGLSLGAQLAGLIGYIFPVGRITGLDPGGPGYPEELPKELRLDRSDADFVDVWHTNAGQCNPFYGIDYDAGDVDFWINDGLYQPACIPYIGTSFLKGDLIYAIATVVFPQLCSHTMSAQYYKVSINPGGCQFVGVKCESLKEFLAGGCRSCGETGDKCLIMGYDTDKYIKNITFPQRYYVKTSLHCPYCNNHYLDLEGYKDTYRKSLQN